MEQDNELLLFDRINVIKDTINKYGEQNFYLSFSGGKDSTILHYLLDMALPNNKIPRVFINTGIEYNKIVEFVKGLASNDDRFILLAPKTPIKQTLDKYGYPFKSKQHSHNVAIYQSHKSITHSLERYLGIIESNTLFRCPNMLEYQFTNKFNVKVSDQCCNQMKKKVIHKWEKKNNRVIAITGMRNSEGGQRASIKGCILTDKNGNIKRFHPLIKINNEFENWFIEKLERERESRVCCELYYPPFNFKRTGCKGCPFSLDLQEQLETMELYLPNERKQCEIIWKPIYDEYRRIGYRLKKAEKIKLF